MLTSVPKDKVEYVLNKVNSINKNLQFTVEVESDGKIPFLDLQIINSNQNITLNIYKKPTSSIRLLNYYSAHPLHQKINIIKQRRDKIYKLSHKKFWVTNLNNLRYILKTNNYPKKPSR